MSYETVRDKIAEILGNATDVGTKIYTYNRLERTESGFKEAFQYEHKILAWTITRGKISEVQEASFRTIQTTSWIIRGYYSLDEKGESEHDFQVLVDNVRDKFRERPTLDGLVLTHGLLQIDTIGNWNFSGVLCHYAEMSLETFEQVSYVSEE